MISCNPTLLLAGGLLMQQTLLNKLKQKEIVKDLPGFGCKIAMSFFLVTRMRPIEPAFSFFDEYCTMHARTLSEPQSTAIT